MKKSFVFMALVAVMSFASANTYTVVNVEMPTAHMPLKIGETCVWQADGKWQQAQCMPGIKTIAAKGKVSATPSDGGYFIFVHMGNPTQDMKPALPWGRYDKIKLEQSGVAVAKDPRSL